MPIPSTANIGTAPINTYASDTDLSLGQVPQVDDPVLYQELLSIHNALEILLTSSDSADEALLAFMAKFRATTKVSSDYQVLITDGTVLVDASLQDVVVTLPKLEDGAVLGYRYDIKRVDSAPSAYKVTLIGGLTEVAGAEELIDEHAAGVFISPLSSYTVKSDSEDNSMWSII